MSNICSIWQAESAANSTSLVVPDGCRDIILKTVINEEKQSGSLLEQQCCFVSPLFDQAKLIHSESCTEFLGVRIKPGVRLEEEKLLKRISAKTPDLDDLINLINDHSYLDASTEEILNCLANEASSVKEAATLLGVSVRSLQRQTDRQTQRPPSYWLQLARVRQAARSISQKMPFIDVAHQHGYSDQSHLNRELRRWLRVAPSDILKRADISAQLEDIGYG